MRIEALITLQTTEKTYGPGEVLEVEEQEAKSLIKLGFAKAADLSGADSSEKTIPPPLGDSDDETTSLIQAIHTLSKEEFTKEGKPKVQALEELLGKTITAKQRDRAFKVYEYQVRTAPAGK